jgi:hypothetical protein
LSAVAAELCALRPTTTPAAARNSSRSQARRHARDVADKRFGSDDHFSRDFEQHGASEFAVLRGVGQLSRRGRCPALPSCLTCAEIGGCAHPGVTGHRRTFPVFPRSLALRAASTAAMEARSDVRRAGPRPASDVASRRRARQRTPPSMTRPVCGEALHGGSAPADCSAVVRHVFRHRRTPQLYASRERERTSPPAGPRACPNSAAKPPEHPSPPLARSSQLAGSHRSTRT